MSNASTTPTRRIVISRKTYQGQYFTEQLDESTTPTRRIVISRKTYQGQYFTEQLDETAPLDLMLIPRGTFWMGQTEAEREELIKLLGEEDYQKYCLWELPRHQVTVSPFFLGKYPITQAQWRAVATYPVVERELKPNPSHFSGDNRPVENVSWDDATEFCLRLSQQTGRTYRLPSEAEWEYACRAGTTTPFHYGETLSDDLANYCAQDIEIEGKLYKGTYGRGIQGKYRQETTEVGLFPPNPFGLYDMHGNVWEWCADDWHDDYTGAPSDGSIWLNNAENDQNNAYKLLRGGAWYVNPWSCRSASRGNDSRDLFVNDVGFRVSCVVPSALLSS